MPLFEKPRWQFSIRALIVVTVVATMLVAYVKRRVVNTINQENALAKLVEYPTSQPWISIRSNHDPVLRDPAPMGLLKSFVCDVTYIEILEVDADMALRHLPAFSGLSEVALVDVEMSSESLYALRRFQIKKLVLKPYSRLDSKCFAAISQLGRLEQLVIRIGDASNKELEELQRRSPHLKIVRVE
jgi:hypothetical protein